MFKQLLIAFLTTLIAGVTFAAGLVCSRLVVSAVGLSAPRLSTQAPESIAGFYLLAGSIVLSGGLALLAKGISASRRVRWLVLSVFLFLGFAVSTTIEASIFSNAAGTLLMIPILLLPCMLLVGVIALLSSSPFSERDIKERIIQFFRARSWQEWIWRIVVASMSFPLIYFVFGLVVSPIVSNYYASGVSGLALPAPALIVQVQFLRSLIHLVAAFPILILWKGNRLRFVIALASAFFVFVFAYDIVLAVQMPAILTLVHGVEVLIDSLVYAWAIFFLLMPDNTQLMQQSTT
ncbi:MAG: hypothetical protein ACOY90_15510 [Candidatus Zhuqueibacterota bacterium]